MTNTLLEVAQDFMTEGDGSFGRLRGTLLVSQDHSSEFGRSSELTRLGQLLGGSKQLREYGGRSFHRAVLKPLCLRHERIVEENFASEPWWQNVRDVPQVGVKDTARKQTDPKTARIFSWGAELHDDVCRHFREQPIDQRPTILPAASPVEEPLHPKPTENAQDDRSDGGAKPRHGVKVSRTSCPGKAGTTTKRERGVPPKTCGDLMASCP